MTEEEALNAKELEDMYIVYAEEIYDKRNNGSYNQTLGYNSKTAKHLTKEEIRDILKKIGYL